MTNHTQDSIYMVWQFAYVHRIAGISLFSGKNTKCGNTFSLSKKRHQNPNLQNNSFYFGSDHNPDQTQLGSKKPNSDKDQQFRDETQ